MKCVFHSHYHSLFFVFFIIYIKPFLICKYIFNTCAPIFQNEGILFYLYDHHINILIRLIIILNLFYKNRNNNILVIID